MMTRGKLKEAWGNVNKKIDELVETGVNVLATGVKKTGPGAVAVGGKKRVENPDAWRQYYDTDGDPTPTPEPTKKVSNPSPM